MIGKKGRNTFCIWYNEFIKQMGVDINIFIYRYFITYRYFTTYRYLNTNTRYVILELQKEQPPQYKGLANDNDRKLHPFNSVKVYKGGFSMPISGTFIEKRYLQL